VEAPIRGFFATCGALHDLRSLSTSLFAAAVIFRCRTEGICLIDMNFPALRMSSAISAGNEGTS